MTSIFRRRITRKVLNPLKLFLSKTDKQRLPYVLPKSFKLLQNKESGSPKFEIAWSELVKLCPELEKHVQPDTLFTYLQNQDYPLEEGVTDIDMETSSEQRFMFSVDQNVFTKTVLWDFTHSFDDVFERSCFFSTAVPERIVLDFSSPNIAKPFHYGHFRSTIIGNFISNIFKAIGHDVVSINYIGDWGLQYGILAVGFNMFGSEEKLKENPLMHLFEVYKEGSKRMAEDTSFADQARVQFQKLEKGDAEAVAQWKHFRDLSLQNLNETYKKLGIKFDEIHGESMYVDKAADVLQVLLEKKLSYCESDGSIQATILNESESEDKVVLRKSDNTTLYLTRDIAAAIDRHSKYHFDSMYYVVDSSQSKHFSHLFHILKEMGYSWYSNLSHVPFGRISNFSTRKGNAVFLEDILNEAQERTLERMKNSPTTKVTENMDETAYILGISSLIINDLSSHRKKEYSFDWDRVLKMTGDSGITLQYCHARLNGIKENCGIKLKLDCDLTSLIEPQAIALIYQLAKFDEAVYRAYTELEPYILVHYLFKLRQAVGRANKVLTVKGQPNNIAEARLALFHTAQLVLNRGLKILGIQPLCRM